MASQQKLHSAYQDFWNWFTENEKRFHKIIKSKTYIEQGFLDPLAAELNNIKDGFYFLVGMSDEETAELIFTADANLSNIVFIEDFVKTAPKIEGWTFEALKPASPIEEIIIEMEGHRFDKDHLHFYPIQNENYPDEIEITVVFDDFDEQDKGKITSGIYLFLENCLGELRFATTIDVLNIEMQKDTTEKELVPIERLQSYLIWREKEYRENEKKRLNE